MERDVPAWDSCEIRALGESSILHPCLSLMRARLQMLWINSSPQEWPFVKKQRAYLEPVVYTLQLNICNFCRVHKFCVFDLLNTCVFQLADLPKLCDPSLTPWVRSCPYPTKTLMGFPRVFPSCKN